MLHMALAEERLQRRREVQEARVEVGKDALPQTIMIVSRAFVADTALHKAAAFCFKDFCIIVIDFTYAMWLVEIACSNSSVGKLPTIMTAPSKPSLTRGLSPMKMFNFVANFAPVIKFSKACSGPSWNV